MTRIAAEIEHSIRARTSLLYLVTWEEERALEMLAGVASSLGRTLWVWTRARGLAMPSGARCEPALADPSALLDHVARSDDRSIFALLDLHPYLNNPGVARQLKDTARELERSSRSIVLISPVLALPLELSKQAWVLDLPLPRPDEIGAMLDAFLARANVSPSGPSEIAAETRDALVRASQGLTAREIADVLARAMVAHGGIDANTCELILAAKRQIVRKSGYLETVAVNDGLADVGGLASLKRWLELRASAFGTRAQRFGLPTPRGLLLAGVQGAGKSLCARCTAAHWQMPLLRLDVGAVFSGIVGSSEANMRHTIALAESLSPCVLWIDEIEKAFRGADQGASDGGTAARVLATMLTWLQEKTASVFVVATANDIDALPPELLRKGRFDEVFFIDLPGAIERAEIFRIHLRKRARNPDAFDTERLASATEGFSGAEIEQAIVAGMFGAFDADRPLETRDIARAIHETVPLARTMSERITAWRRWAATRARPAGTPIVTSTRGGEA